MIIKVNISDIYRLISLIYQWC